jgi:hypothetical protein
VENARLYTIPDELPQYFEDVFDRFAAGEMDAEEVVCGPGRQKHLAAIHEMFETGCDQVYAHQVGPNQEGFFDFYLREILPDFK